MHEYRCLCLFFVLLVGCTQNNLSATKDSPSELEADSANATARAGNDRKQDEQTPIGKENEAAKTRKRSEKPWSVHQYEQFFDAREFVEELGLGDVDVHSSLGKEASASASADAKDVWKLCEQRLAESGWEKAFARQYGTYGERHFTKENQTVEVSVNAGLGQSHLGVQLLGNVDMRLLPIGNTADVDDENSNFALAMYETSDSIDETLKYCCEEMRKQGWKQFEVTSSPSPLPHLAAPNRTVPFVQKGYACYLYVAKSQKHQDKTTVYYRSIGILPIDLVITEDAEEIQLGLEHGKASYKSLKVKTEIREIVAKHFSNLNYPLIESGGKRYFIDIYKSGEREQVLVDITPRDNGVTSVQLIRQFDKE